MLQNRITMAQTGILARLNVWPTSSLFRAEPPDLAADFDAQPVVHHPVDGGCRARRTLEDLTPFRLSNITTLRSSYLSANDPNRTSISSRLCWT
jgi:hypothetical protein